MERVQDAPAVRPLCPGAVLGTRYVPGHLGHLTAAFPVKGAVGAGVWQYLPYIPQSEPQ